MLSSTFRDVRRRNLSQGNHDERSEVPRLRLINTPLLKAPLDATSMEEQARPSKRGGIRRLERFKSMSASYRSGSDVDGAGSSAHSNSMRPQRFRSAHQFRGEWSGTVSFRLLRRKERMRPESYSPEVPEIPEVPPRTKVDDGMPHDLRPLQPSFDELSYHSLVPTHPTDIIDCADAIAYAAASESTNVLVTMAANSTRVLLWTCEREWKSKPLRSTAVTPSGAARFNDFLTISASGNWAAATFRAKRSVALWNTKTGMEAHTPFYYQGHTFLGLALSGDGTKMFLPAQKGRRGHVMLRRCTRSHEKVVSWPLAGQPSDCATCDDGSVVACCVQDRKEIRVCLFDGETGTVIRHFDGFSNRRPRVFIDRQAQRLVMLDAARFYLFDVARSQIVRTGDGPKRVTSASVALNAASDDGILVGWDDDGVLVARHIATGDIIARLLGFDGVSCLTCVSGDGAVVLAGDARRAQLVVWARDLAYADSELWYLG